MTARASPRWSSRTRLSSISGPGGPLTRPGQEESRSAYALSLEFVSMPIYEYRCEACEGSFEVLTSFAERERGQVCPTCESPRTRVQVSSFASIGGPAELSPSLPMASGGGCCGGSCGCGSKN